MDLLNRIEDDKRKTSASQYITLFTLKGLQAHLLTFGEKFIFFYMDPLIQYSALGV